MIAKNKNRYHSGYAELAQAILISGTQANDQLFLNSDWAEVLREICRMDDNMYGDRELRVTRGRIDYIGG